jgi:undecaprenyl-diphosphatase
MPALEETACLGLLHGLTEFLPISSDGHVALAETLLDLGGGATGGLSGGERLTLHACLRVGSLLAALVYFRARIAGIAVELWHCLRSSQLPRAAGPGGDAVILLCSSVPTALLGLALQPVLLHWQARPLAIGFGFIVTALLLTSTLWARPGSRSSISLSGAALLGVAQGLACLPGLSRSAANLTTLSWLGVRPERAFELAMLATLPASLGTLGLQLWAADGPAQPALPLVLGAAAAFGTGLLGLGLMRRLVARSLLPWLSLWMLPVALATLALAKAWPR